MKQPLPLSPGLALGWALLLTFALFAVNVAIGGLLGPTNLALVVAGPVELLLMWPASQLIARLYGSGRQSRDFAWAPVPPLELLIAASLGVLVHLPIGYVGALVERRFPTPTKQLQLELAMLTPSSPAMAIGMFLSAAVIVAFVEELFFRGALFGALRRGSSGAVSIVTTSVAFALAHPKPRDWAALFVIALALGEVRRQSGSIWPGVALHAAFNATTLLFVFITRPVEVTPQAGSWQLACIGTALTLSGLVLYGRVASRRFGEVS